MAKLKLLATLTKPHAPTISLTSDETGLIDVKEYYVTTGRVVKQYSIIQKDLQQFITRQKQFNYQVLQRTKFSISK
jgi:hypothetical protein